MLTRAAKRRHTAAEAAEAAVGGGSGGHLCCSRARAEEGGADGCTFVEQRFYECLTCGLTLERGVGLCAGCRHCCHAGHDTRFVGRLRAYCDCSCGGLGAGSPGGGSSSEEEEQGMQGYEEGEVDPRLRNHYGEKAYWEERYRESAEDTEDEWLVGYREIEHIIRPQLEALRQRQRQRQHEGGVAPAPSSPPRQSRRCAGGATAAAAAGGGGDGGLRVLMVGCGDSELSAALYDGGYEHITNIDISEACIDKMRRRHGERRPHMRYLAADATELSCEAGFAHGSFDVVMDKTLLDALCCSADALDTVPKMVDGIQRVLRPGGLYIIISFSLRCGEASAKQAALEELVLSSFDEVLPPVAMVVGASDDASATAVDEQGFNIFVLRNRSSR